MERFEDIIKGKTIAPPRASFQILRCPTLPFPEDHAPRMIRSERAGLDHCREDYRRVKRIQEMRAKINQLDAPGSSPSRNSSQSWSTPWRRVPSAYPCR